jgi:hypothetical protein
MLNLPRLWRVPMHQTWALTIMLLLAAPQASGAGAAYPVQGREPIEVLADQIRDGILQRRDESCDSESCPNMTAAKADDIRQGCLRDTVAKHPHGIGGENDLVACMERKSGFSLNDSASNDRPGLDDARESDDPDDYAAPNGLGAARAIIPCQNRDGSFEMRERGGCLDSGGAVIERVQ